MYIKQSIPKIPISELKELEHALPHGAKKEIRERTGLSRTSIDDVFKGKFYNEEVIDIACQLTRISLVSSTQTRKKIAYATQSR